MLNTTNFMSTFSEYVFHSFFNVSYTNEFDLKHANVDLGLHVSIYAKDFGSLVVGLRCLSSKQLIDFCLIEYVTRVHLPQIRFVWGAQPRLLDSEQHVFYVQGQRFSIWDLYPILQGRWCTIE